MGHRSSKSQRQLQSTTSANVSTAGSGNNVKSKRKALPSKSAKLSSSSSSSSLEKPLTNPNNGGDATPIASITSTPTRPTTRQHHHRSSDRLGLQQATSIVIKICMLKVDEPFSSSSDSKATANGSVMSLPAAPACGPSDNPSPPPTEAATMNAIASDNVNGNLNDISVSEPQPPAAKPSPPSHQHNQQLQSHQPFVVNAVTNYTKSLAASVAALVIAVDVGSSKRTPTTSAWCNDCQRPLPQCRTEQCGVQTTNATNAMQSSQSPLTIVKSKKINWKLNCAKLITGKVSSSSSSSSSSAAAIASSSTPTTEATAAVVNSSVAFDEPSTCVCTSYRKVDKENETADSVLAITARLAPDNSEQRNAVDSDNNAIVDANNVSVCVVDVAAAAAVAVAAADDDCDESARQRRAEEIANGIEAPPGFLLQRMSAISPNNNNNNSSNSISIRHTQDPLAAANVARISLVSSSPVPEAASPALASSSSSSSSTAAQNAGVALGRTTFDELLPPQLRLIIHSQVDYIHCLVPDLQRITASTFYWGKMDRYEAERLLDGKPEGTFLLRDSAQEEFLFSVSFRKYGRSLHARIEQFNHKFSFDCHDPGVFTSGSVTGLLEHYKDPACVMFFEPALTLPLLRNYCFALQELCRAAIVSRTTYDGVGELMLPVTLRSYLREYHYRQRVRVQRYDEPLYVAAPVLAPAAMDVQQL